MHLIWSQIAWGAESGGRSDSGTGRAANEPKVNEQMSSHVTTHVPCYHIFARRRMLLSLGVNNLSRCLAPSRTRSPKHLCKYFAGEQSNWIFMNYLLRLQPHPSRPAPADEERPTEEEPKKQQAEETRRGRMEYSPNLIPGCNNFLYGLFVCARRPNQWNTLSAAVKLFIALQWPQQNGTVTMNCR